MNYHPSCIRVEQPFGVFYLFSMKAGKLLPFIEDRRIPDDPLPYGQPNEVVFPTPLVLAATNWTVAGQIADYHLEIPSWSRGTPATILHGHLYLETMKKNLDADIACCVFLDLPRPFQGYLFALSNKLALSNAAASLLFGGDLTDTDYSTFSPEKLATFLTRRLNADSSSPLFGRILPTESASYSNGILALISSDPEKDYEYLNNLSRLFRKRGALPDDGSPLRRLYLEGNDLAIYTLISTFLSIYAAPDAFARLKRIAGEALRQKDFSPFYLEALIEVDRLETDGVNQS